MIRYEEDIAYQNDPSSSKSSGEQQLQANLSPTSFVVMQTFVDRYNSAVAVKMVAPQDSQVPESFHIS